MQRTILFVSALSGFLAVALGAFGAHGLESRLGSLVDGAKRLEWWRTAAHYQLVHAVALGVCASLVTHQPARALAIASLAFGLGSVVFSGSLYLMALGAPRALGALTPFGGLAFLMGWAALAWAACTRR